MDDLTNVSTEELIRLRDDTMAKIRQIKPRAGTGRAVGFLGNVGDSFLRGLRPETKTKKDTRECEAKETIKDKMERVRLGEAMTQFQSGGTAGIRPKSINIGGISYERVPSETEITQEEEQKATREEASLKRKALYGTENQNAIRKAFAQMGNVNIMTNKLFQIPAGRGEYATKIGAFITGGVTQKQADIAEYEDFVQANSAGLYRDLTGDNRLSDMDAQARALPLIPRPQQDRRLQLQKTYKLKFMLRKRAEMLQTSPEEVNI